MPHEEPRAPSAVSSAHVAGATSPGGGPGAGRRGPLTIYGDVIRKRWRQPAFRGRLPDANAVAEDVNPLCGDRVRIELDVEDDRVRAARFGGDSCAICTASADVLAEKVSGRSVQEARTLGSRDLLEALEADIRPTRMRCVTLPLDVLRIALESGAAR